MKHTALRLSALLVLSLAFNTAAKAASSTAWEPVGPPGGDARSFAADPTNPKHIYMGTLDSWIYESQDGGSTWKRLVKLGKSENLVLDNIVVDAADPKTILVGAWILNRPEGALYVTHDSGATWSTVPDMDGESIRALVQARSNPKVMVAGTLKGVYRSDNGGAHWKQISPPGSNELHEVESIAIDPAEPNTIYAGTWHLPWKTTDNGSNWRNIKQGVIDDSDVFSIIIDPKLPTVVYASACSGIYKSENGGEIFRKQQGIPNTARRTRVLMQDPVNTSIVFAGTTEGLYQTTNAGASWQRLTGPDVIINDVYVDPSNDKHVLLATDRSGVLQSQDGGASFAAANTGFSQRQVQTLLVDSRNPATIYAGVLNDKTYGGVFVSQDGGSTWTQQSNGLDGRDVFTLQQAPNGTIYAGTNRGILGLGDDGWDDHGKVVNTREEETTKIVKKKKVKVTKTVTEPAVMLEGRVTGLDLSGSTWYAATASGLYTSINQGSTWQGGPVSGHSDFLRVVSSGDITYAAGRQFILSTQDGGKTWQSGAMPPNVPVLRFLVTSSDGNLWLASREGVFYSEDHAQSWKQLSSLPFSNVDGFDFNQDTKRLMVTSANGTLLMAIDPVKKDWKWWDIGWNVHTVHTSAGRFVAASLFDGVVLQPKASPELAADAK
ncbi:Glycosyl hydrolase, BNR repeat precursor [Acidisarcina polymorpha]|uniref:Glycosyl hydrolase, BNR repeat n=1 Tax=Acidisarcina polymorpha TaxID=2211140 RepID=A0A2Z5FS70_9BACT|nr:YCF48-related protein [Acidisarcina polymorpha]AXC09609.1 Glycosyl hydrolase, BNR repeat precursor [Acidisarcina polymorpha]